MEIPFWIWDSPQYLWIHPYGWLVILEQRLSFATHGFPGFGEQFYQKTE